MIDASCYSQNIFLYLRLFDLIIAISIWAFFDL